MKDIISLNAYWSGEQSTLEECTLFIQELLQIVASVDRVWSSWQYWNQTNPRQPQQLTFKDGIKIKNALLTGANYDDSTPRKIIPELGYAIDLSKQNPYYASISMAVNHSPRVKLVNSFSLSFYPEYFSDSTLSTSESTAKELAIKVADFLKPSYLYLVPYSWVRRQGMPPNNETIGWINYAKDPLFPTNNLPKGAYVKQVANGYLLQTGPTINSVKESTINTIRDRSKLRR
ncbi:hypothetical protein [Corynebacterium massiliense]|uniref:hypothetical protein n=1 Tax=Corynebacterium massiliense TaxID=441501 RepID=UPI002354F268|nr:hypothetical protein [Corynebacterium massiliense]